MTTHFVLCFPRTYSSSLCSIAKARTVRTLPRASSATPVALAICMETEKQGVGYRQEEGQRRSRRMSQRC